MHLRKGSIQPPRAKEKPILYSMTYCSFAHRVRLVLSAKNIPHEIVNVHVFDKPDWLWKLNPLGQVPILDTGSAFISGSFDISNYLNETYPNRPLYCSNEVEVARDKKLVNNFDRILKHFHDIIMTPNNPKSYDEYMQDLMPLVQEYEDELKMRKTTFFGGNVPGMVDYMIWPSAERSSLLGSIFERETPNATVFPCLYAWCDAMRKQPEVIETKLNLENQKRIYKKLKSNDYDVDFDV